MTWQYIAGFFDGEGNINTSSSRGLSWQVRIVQTDKDILEEIKKCYTLYNIDSTIYTSYTPQNYKKSNKTLYTLNVVGRNNIVRLLQQLLPFCRVKKTLIQDCLRFLILNPSRNRRACGKFNTENKGTTISA